MRFSELVRNRRQEMGLGIRETARRTDRSYVPFPIKSAVYISRIENEVEEEQRAAAVSIDKLWALGVALEVHPLVLFAYSRSLPELVDDIPMFGMREFEPAKLCRFLREKRKLLDLTITAVGEVSKQHPWSISYGYLSQLEDCSQDHWTAVSAEKLWTLGRIYDVDPLLMYVLSRQIDSSFLSASLRDKLFS